MYIPLHQYAYFFSLLLFILPISLAFDASLKFRVLRTLVSWKGLSFILISVIFWSLFDVLWVHGLGTFPSDRIFGFVFGVPIEEMMLFVIGFYNIATIFAWAKQRYP